MVILGDRMAKKVHPFAYPGNQTCYVKYSLGVVRAAGVGEVGR
jgi:hypothetical protein